MIFKGGTCLWFFHNLGRFSEDLDFTAKGKLPEDIANVVSRRISLFGVQNSLRELKDNGLRISFRILTNGPLHTGGKDRCSVYVEISIREKLFLAPESKKLDFPGYLLPVKSISCMNLAEVAAEKVRAILTRRKARDLYDLNHIVAQNAINFNRELIDEKLSFYDLKFNREKFIEEVESRAPYIGRELKQIILSEIPEANRIIENIEEWIE